MRSACGWYVLGLCLGACAAMYVLIRPDPPHTRQCMYGLANLFNRPCAGQPAVLCGARLACGIPLAVRRGRTAHGGHACRRLRGGRLYSSRGGGALRNRRRFEKERDTFPRTPRVPRTPHTPRTPRTPRTQRTPRTPCAPRLCAPRAPRVFRAAARLHSSGYGDRFAAIRTRASTHSHSSPASLP